MRFPVFNRARKGTRLFYQIAKRLVLVAALFAVLEVVIVIAMYLNDEETLSEDLVSLESNRIAVAISRQGRTAADGDWLALSPTRALVLYDDSGNRLLVVNPGRVPLPDAPL